MIMKKNIFILIICVGLFLSNMKLSSSEKQSEQPTLVSVLMQIAAQFGLQYVYDALQKYLPETRQTKMARMQEKILESQYEQFVTPPTKKPIDIEQANITFADYIDVPKEAIKLVEQLKNPERFIKA